MITSSRWKWMGLSAGFLLLISEAGAAEPMTYVPGTPQMYNQPMPVFTGGSPMTAQPMPAYTQPMPAYTRMAPTGQMMPVTQTMPVTQSMPITYRSAPAMPYTATRVLPASSSSFASETIQQKPTPVQTTPPATLGYPTEIIYPCDDCCAPNPCAPEKCERAPIGIGVFAEFLQLSVCNAEVPFAQPRDGCTFLSVPAGEVGVVEPGFASGFRGGFLYAINPESKIMVAYSTFASSSEGSINAPDGTVLRSLLLHPNVLDCGFDSQAAIATLDIDFDLIDLDYHHELLAGCNWVIDGLVGVRYGRLKQELLAEFSIVGENTVHTTLDFEGVGPRLGLEGEYRLCSGFYAYGRSAASILVGDFEATYLHTSEFDGVLVSTAIETCRVVPILDLELGLGWSCWNDVIRLQAGYQIGSWFDVMTTTGWVQAVQTDNFTTNGDNLRDFIAFYGFVFHGEYRY